MGSEMFEKKKPDPLWEAIMKEYDRLQHEEGLKRSTRSPGYMSPSGGKLCVAWFYPKDSDDTTRVVYHIEAYLTHRGDVKVDLDGPYEDAGDQFWQERLEADKAKGNWIVTDKYDHFTILPDSKQPGQGDGHGGSLFVFELKDRETAFRLNELPGINVHYEGGKYILRSRNVWSQGVIPKKHREKFPPRATIVPRVVDVTLF
jgi:hypothetical protein